MAKTCSKRVFTLNLALQTLCRHENSASLVFSVVANLGTLGRLQ